MRFRSFAAIAASLVVLEGCNLALPTGLLQNLENGGKGPGPQGGDCQAMFFQFDVNGDKSLSQDEYVNGRLAQLGMPPMNAQPAASATASGTATSGTSADSDTVVQLQAAFDALDTNGDGEVSLQEFLTQCQGPAASPSPMIKVLPPIGTPPSVLPPPCTAFFGQFDRNNDGRWSQGEFSAWYISLPMLHAQICTQPVPAGTPMPELGLNDPLASPPVLASATGSTLVGTLIANNGSALLPIDDGLKPVDATPAPTLCGAQLEAFNLFQKFDLDHDGQLSEGEACTAIEALMPKPPLPPGSTPMPYPPIDEPSPTPYLPSCEDNFRNADQNQNLRLELNEFFAAEGGLNNAQAEAALTIKFNALDSNHNGYLTADEFCGADAEPSPPALPPTPTPMPATPTPGLVANSQ